MFLNTYWHILERNRTEQYTLGKLSNLPICCKMQENLQTLLDTGLKWMKLPIDGRISTDP